MAVYVVDIETNGFNATKIHVMSVGYKDSEGKWQIKSTSNYDDIRKVMCNPDNTVIGHNFYLFDVVQIEKVLECEVKATVIDTLALSWYIYPKRTQSTFGLAAFGEDYGIKKPEIEDWDGLSYEEYKNRCEEDVRININLWCDIRRRLTKLYGTWEDAQSLIRYLMFKMKCLQIQQKIKCKIDLDTVSKNMSKLTPMLEEKEAVLIKAMPLGKVIKTKPKVMVKADGKTSVLGQNWKDYLEEHDLPSDTEEVREPANPASTPQLKKWLFSFGWKPLIFKNGANGRVPQVRDKEKQLCKSILKLVKKEPAIDALDGLTVISHRLGVLKGFLETSDSDGYAVAGAAGFTNTLRLRHKKPITNLPKVDDGAGLRNGRIIRECIIAPEGYELCGSDISSLEDMTKRHYIWKYDPDYVKSQMEEDYCAHLDLAERAGAITIEQMKDHKSGVKSYKSIRDIYKEANYSCVYGVGASTLSLTTGLKVMEAKTLIKSYWDRNWAVKRVTENVIKKVIDDQIWIYNPVSGFWYSSRDDRNFFSVLNQGTGAFVFDCWIKFMVEEGVEPFIQYHDEILCLTIDKSEFYNKPAIKLRDILERSMQKVNDILKLNVEIKVDVQVGKTYADVH